MEKPVAAVEFGSKKMKLVVGYELDGQVYVIYSLVRPYGSIIENGEIIDPTKIIQSMKEIRNFSDPTVQESGVIPLDFASASASDSYPSPRH